MDSSKSSINDFELLLQKKSFKKPSFLYRKDFYPSGQTYTPQEVIKTVCSQVKAIQLADHYRNGKIGSKNMNEEKKSQLLCLNKLPVYGSMREVPKPNQHKVETQGFLNTQLINIIDGAAIINANTGMTQEFDTTFSYCDDINSENPKPKDEDKSSHGESKSNYNENMNNDIANYGKMFTLDESTKKYTEGANKLKKKSDIQNNSIKQSTTNHNSIQDSVNYPKAINKEQNSQTSVTATFIENIPVTQDVNEELKEIDNSIDMDIDIDTGQEMQRSLSPVLDFKAVKKYFKTSSPLVVSLETFENFVNFAVPLIEGTDYETAKHIINSQILGKRLCFNDTEVLLGIERVNSPILDFKSDDLQIASNELISGKNANEVVSLQDIENITEQCSEILKDEILFSSDEENFSPKEFQNLPLTYPLEISNDQIALIDKTLYVGFQTASNKSIEVTRDSYEQAQSMFSGIEVKVDKEFSLSKLVNICDRLKPKYRKIRNTSTTPTETYETKLADLEPVSDVFNDRLRNKTRQTDNKTYSENIETNITNDSKDYMVTTLKQQCYGGFMTASNKKIDMSNKALQRCQKVFKDINLNEKFYAVEVSINTDPAAELKFCLEKPENKVSSIEDNDDKINDELLLEEFENTEMSLEKKESNGRCKGQVAFEGFKTASNKNITISKKAIAKTTNFFQDIDMGIKDQNNDANNGDGISEKITEIEGSNHSSISKAVFVSFKTANNNEIKISDEALAKSKNIFKDIGKNKHEMKSVEHIIVQPSTHNLTFIGFKTANNKDVKISNKALAKTKYIFKDIDKEETKRNVPVNNSKLSSSKIMSNETERSKDTKVSEDALSKSKNILTQNAKAILAKSYDIQGFKAANNKEVKMSDHVLVKSKHLFSDLTRNDNSKVLSEKHEDAVNKLVNVSMDASETTNGIFSHIDPIDYDINDTIKVNHKNKYETMFKGFQTASKKLVTVSADALARSKSIFKDLDDNILETVPKTLNAEFMDFQIANKIPVDVSKDVLIVSKKFIGVFNDKAIENPSGFVGFQTASNKNFVISDEVLAKCKEKIDNIEYISIPEKQPPLKPRENIFRGFQTANKKKIDISEEARTKNLFDSIGELAKQDAESFAGFQTANNKKVIVSKQALAASRQLFQDTKGNEVNFQEKNVLNTTEKLTTHAFGFQTGNNQKVTFSEDALIKSKKLFAEFSEKDVKHNTEGTEKEFLINLKEKNDILNVDKMLDTQVMNDFEQDVCSEDFKDTKLNKRSGSPILPCPKPKIRKKFEAPYKNTPTNTKNVDKNMELTKNKDTIIFKEDYKKNKSYTMKDLSKLEYRESQNVDPYILNFNLEQILSFEFNDDRNDFQDGKMTIDEVKQIFTEATHKKLIPDGWLDIHLKLILWKLISYEIRFPNILGKVCTVRNVIDQLKYRYDKELYNAERSILRKILEKDDVPNKTMVLCVAGIYVDGVSVTNTADLNNIELLLTDGWYFLKTTIDKMLSKLVYDGKIVVGSKIVTCGAELVGCEQGVAPWEDISSVRLSISGNSTRPARWHEKLGLRSTTMTARLAAVRLGGGRVARLRLAVARLYPTLYVEKLQDGSTVTRSERLEHQYQMKYEAEKEAMIERIYEEVEKEMSNQESQDSIPDTDNKRKCLDSGTQIAKVMKASIDPMEFRAQLTSSQVHLLQDHVSKQRDKYLQVIQDRVRERLQARNVIALARGRVVGLEKDGDKVTVTKGMLSIWKPNDEVLDIFKEGSWIEVSNVVPTAFRNSEIQLSAGRKSVFRPVKCKEDTFQPYLKSLSRICYNLKDISHNPSMTTDYNEVDIVGMIFAIEPSNRDFDSNKNQFQNVYLADIDKNMICVNFWGGIKKFGYENILDTGQVIYCANLQKRAGNSRKNISQFRATEFTIFSKTPKNVKGREMVDEMNKKLFGLDRRKCCQDCVVIKQNFSVIRCLNDSENVTPYRFNNSDYNLGRNKAFIETPVGVTVKSNAENFNLTGLDFESTFRHQDTQLSPKSLERKKKVNEKIARLKMYGEPPPLSPINIFNKSKNATNSYKSPLLKSETSNSATVVIGNKLQSVATPIKLADNIVENLLNSPNISNNSMNQTYIKRTSVNPVKLNFENVDHFAEEFDGSPPLSLE